MLKYYWIIEDILRKKPTEYTIIMHDNFFSVIQLINLYLKNICEYGMEYTHITSCFDRDTIIKLYIKWPDATKEAVAA